MRSLIILKGLAKTKKLEWVRKEGLEPFLIDIEHLRRLYYRPEFRIDSKEFLSRSFDDTIYKIFIQVICSHLGTGCLTVIDMEDESTTIVEDLALIYGYTIFYYIDKPPVDYVKKNRRYGGHLYSPISRDVLRKKLLEFNRTTYPDKNIISSYQEVELYWRERENRIAVREDEPVLHISDLHSHYRILNDRIPSPEDFPLTVFMGDYIDGPETNGSRKLMTQILNYEGEDNIIFLEGNHELRLRKFFGYQYLKSKGKRIASEVLLGEISNDFLTKTSKEFDDICGSIEPRNWLIKMNEKLLEYVIYYRGCDKYVCTHAGLKSLDQLSPKFIGNVIYSSRNSERTDETFSLRYADSNIYSFHGHCSYPSGLIFCKYPGVVNIDAEDEFSVNYFINNPKNKFNVCVLKD